MKRRIDEPEDLSYVTFIDNESGDEPVQSDEAYFDYRDRRRLAAEDRYLARVEKREKEAEALVGELCREGTTIFYINVRSKEGRLTGKTREFADQGSAIAYLLRNNYV